MNWVFDVTCARAPTSANPAYCYEEASFYRALASVGQHLGAMTAAYAASVKA
jgi:hypothetical protein